MAGSPWTHGTSSARRSCPAYAHSTTRGVARSRTLSGGRRASTSAPGGAAARSPATGSARDSDLRRAACPRAGRQLDRLLGFLAPPPPRAYPGLMLRRPVLLASAPLLAVAASVA